jgi:hypothetical protein
VTGLSGNWGGTAKGVVHCTFKPLTMPPQDLLLCLRISYKIQVTHIAVTSALKRISNLGTRDMSQTTSHRPPYRLRPPPLLSHILRHVWHRTAHSRQPLTALQTPSELGPLPATKQHSRPFYRRPRARPDSAWLSGDPRHKISCYILWQSLFLGSLLGFAVHISANNTCKFKRFSKGFSSPSAL